MTALHDLTVATLAAELRAKKVSATELAQHFLERSQADASGAFLSLNPEATLAQAKVATVMSCKAVIWAPYSMTLGTKNKPRSTAGALCWLASRWLGSEATSSRKRKATSWMVAIGCARG